ncbi:MAG: ATP-binding cassette domain-containing protein, partial [Pseudomonadota bacterium]
MVAVRLKNINKVFDSKNRVVKDFTLEINDKEFIVFVGPSGCGKTTTLR